MKFFLMAFTMATSTLVLADNCSISTYHANKLSNSQIAKLAFKCTKLNAKPKYKNGLHIGENCNLNGFSSDQIHLAIDLVGYRVNSTAGQQNDDEAAQRVLTSLRDVVKSGACK